MSEVGTLKELGVKPGDVVEFVKGCYGMYPHFIGKQFTMTTDNRAKSNDAAFYDSVDHKFRIVSRASGPKLWRDMTPEEKGALLLAHYEGKVIQNASKWVTWGDCCNPSWDDGIAYRVKPEPKVETVTMTGEDVGSGESVLWSFRQNCHIGQETHRITFNTIDGKPDPASIRMEAI